MTKEEILKGIETASNNAYASKVNAQNIEYNRVIAKVRAIQETYCPMVKELKEMTLYAISKGYAIQPNGCAIMSELPNTATLMTDAIHHGIGFIGEQTIDRFTGRYNKKPELLGIGFMGGGCCGGDFLVTEDGVYYNNVGGCHNMKCYRNAYEFNLTEMSWRHLYWSGLEKDLDSFPECFEKFKAQVENWLEHISSYKNYLY